MIPERIGGTVEANAKDKGRAHNGGEEDAVSSGKGVVKGAGQTHGVQAEFKLDSCLLRQILQSRLATLGRGSKSVRT